MEISAKVLREVEFSGSLRGYNTDEVDEFLEQVAVAVDRLEEESRLAAERAESERAGRERVGMEDEESIRRTLLLAQRTADLAIKEAQEQAAVLVDHARAEAEVVIGEASQHAERLATDAEQHLRDEVARLLASRDSLRTEIDSLVKVLDAERERLTESLSTALRFVETSLTPSGEIAEMPAASGLSWGYDAAPGGEDMASSVRDAGLYGAPSYEGDDRHDSLPEDSSSVAADGSAGPDRDEEGPDEDLVAGPVPDDVPEYDWDSVARVSARRATSRA